MIRHFERSAKKTADASAAGGEKSSVVLMKVLLTGTPHKIPPRTYRDFVVISLVGMTCTFFLLRRSGG
ncbi:MAG TPA: hypothetical protein VLX91_17125 [Candidatus Acidoferrales bacterium]|nr:hypothetical protein [Candidatus Acidoferrales bacterium]